MDAGTLRKLQAIDDPRHCDYPPGFDWQSSVERVRTIQPMLEEIAGTKLSFDDQVQDASYFADLCITEPHDIKGFKHRRVRFVVSFSCFGSLVTICNEDVFPEEKISRMRVALESYGFVFVDAAHLREPYTGSHTHFSGSTWMDRFFNYT